MERQDIAILYSGSVNCLALYAMSMGGIPSELKRTRTIHVLNVSNGAESFLDFPAKRLEVAKKILERQMPLEEVPPKTSYVELDASRLFQALWLNRFEELMPIYNGKNLVCIACRLAKHIKALTYAVINFVPKILADFYQGCSLDPSWSNVFFEKISELSSAIGVLTVFPVHEQFGRERGPIKAFLEDKGLPSVGGGEVKCLLSSSKSSATEDEVRQYFDKMMPEVINYCENILAGRIKEASTWLNNL